VVKAYSQEATERIERDKLAENLVSQLQARVNFSLQPTEAL
jgi:hypothetical protein